MSAAADMIPLAVKFISSLAVVLGLLALMLFALRRLSNRAGGGETAAIRVLASRALGVKKTVFMVQVPGRILVLAVAGDAIRLLTEIDDPEVLDAWGQAPLAAGGPSVPSFKDQFARIVSRFGPEASRADIETR